MNSPDFEAWTRVPLCIGPDYDYLRRGKLRSLCHHLVTALATVLLIPVDYLVLGLRYTGWSHLRQVRGTNVVAVCNHVHTLDCTMVARTLIGRRRYFLTLQSNLELRGIRHLVRVLGGVPIPRDRRQLPAFRQAVLAALSEGSDVIVYPEGELRPYAEKLSDFKNTAFSLAYTAGVPVLPLRITFARRGGIFRLKKQPCMTVHILPPVFPRAEAGRVEEVRRLRDTARQEMEAAGMAETL